MGTDTVQLKAEEDECVYIYNMQNHAWSKLRDVSPKELPESIRKKIQEVQRSTAGNSQKE